MLTANPALAQTIAVLYGAIVARIPSLASGRPDIEIRPEMAAACAISRLREIALIADAQIYWAPFTPPRRRVAAFVP